MLKVLISIVHTKERLINHLITELAPLFLVRVQKIAFRGHDNLHLTGTRDIVYLRASNC